MNGLTGKRGRKMNAHQPLIGKLKKLNIYFLRKVPKRDRVKVKIRADI